MPTLQLINLNKAYSPKVIPVRDVSLAVADGEVLSLLGPSGCGKSTILRMIAGLEEPTHGQILLGDRDITYLKPGDRHVAMVFQSYALYPHMTVYENLCAGLKLQQVPKAEIKQRVQDVSRILGLDPALMSRKPGQLSGGQRQRVAVGRALVRQSDVLLLDEPLSNLDALLRERVRADLKQIFEAQNVPVVYVTHDQTEAMTLSTKVAVLNNGYLQQVDTPDRIYRRPANQFVAGFVGSPQMNLLPLPCRGHHAFLGEFKLPLPAPLTAQSHIVMGIRPEHVQLAKTGEPASAQGEILLVENLGMHHLVTLQLANPHGNPLRLRVLLPVHQTWDQPSLAVLLPPSQLHWFDVNTGDRLA